MLLQPHYYRLKVANYWSFASYFTIFYTIDFCWVHIPISVCKRYLCVHCICIKLNMLLSAETNVDDDLFPTYIYKASCEHHTACIYA